MLRVTCHARGWNWLGCLLLWAHVPVLLFLRVDGGSFILMPKPTVLLYAPPLWFLLSCEPPLTIKTLLLSTGASPTPRNRTKSPCCKLYCEHSFLNYFWKMAGYPVFNH